MLAGIEDIDDTHIFVRYLVNNLVSPLGYRSVVIRLISKVFLFGVFFREVAQGSTKLDQGFLNIFSRIYRVLGNIVKDVIKPLLSLW